MVEYALAISIRPQKYKIDAFDFKIVKGDPNLLGYFITTSELCPNYSAEWKSSKKRNEIQYIWSTVRKEVNIFIQKKMQEIKEKMDTELPPEGSW